MWPPPLKRKSNEIQWEGEYEHDLCVPKANSNLETECCSKMTLLRLDNELAGNNMFNLTLLLKIDHFSKFYDENRFPFDEKGIAQDWKVIWEHLMTIPVQNGDQGRRKTQRQVFAKIKREGEYLRVLIVLSLMHLPFDVGDEKDQDLRTNPSQEGGYDEDIQGLKSTSQVKGTSKDNSPIQGLGGPMTRAKAKKAKEALQGMVQLLMEDTLQLEDTTLQLKGQTTKGVTLIRMQDCMEPQ